MRTWERSIEWIQEIYRRYDKNLKYKLREDDVYYNHQKISKMLEKDLDILYRLEQLELQKIYRRRLVLICFLMGSILVIMSSLDFVGIWELTNENIILYSIGAGLIIFPFVKKAKIHSFNVEK
ncbi:MAG: hypothetical protein ACMUIG_05930 [Thermoplasmatota archaeon]